MTNNRPKKSYVFYCLIIIGIIFYSTYGLSNWMAENRRSVPEIFFTWEQSIPFYAWTIIPYWSLNLFYVLSFFIVRDKITLHLLIQRLLLAQIIAVSCFIIYPLTFSWAKPEVSGFSGILFNFLAGFDQPYNQMPSLHIILTVILGHFYWSYLPKFCRIPWLIWLIIIVTSVLTTYQHHFIDIPTGFLVACFILWLLPDHKNDSIFRYFKQRKYFKPTIIYLSLSTLFTALSFLGGMFLWCLWAALSLLLVALNYYCLGPAGFQKTTKGKMTFAAYGLFLPYLIGVRFNILFWLWRKPKVNHIYQNIHLGSVYAAKKFDVIFDVCAEYPCIRKSDSIYNNHLLMDMVCPTLTDLNQAADKLENQLKQQDKPLLLCCALGMSRSALVLITWLLKYQYVRNIEEALQLLKNNRKTVVLKEDIIQLIRQAYE